MDQVVAGQAALLGKAAEVDDLKAALLLVCGVLRRTSYVEEAVSEGGLVEGGCM
jgi:hypothetical protein